MVCDHADRNKLNCNVSNMRYITQSLNVRNQSRTHAGQAVEWFDELPDGAEPITEAHGRPVADGYFQSDRAYYSRVGDQYKRLTASRHNRNGWHVQVRGPNGEQINISWHV
jgi:hypothetical protein